MDSVISKPTRPEGALEVVLNTTVFELLKTKKPPTKNTPLSILTTAPFPLAPLSPEAPAELTVVAVTPVPEIVIISPSSNVFEER